MPQERNIVTNTSDALVARNQIGLEISGPNTEFPLNSQEAFSIINNADEISLFGRVKGKFLRFGDLISEAGKWVDGKKLEIAGGILLTATAAACGGGSKDSANQVSKNPDVPAAPAVVRTIETTSTPAPAVNNKVEAPNTEVLLSVPAEAQKFLNNINSIKTLPEESKTAIRNGFERDLEKAKTGRNDFQKSEPYTNLYSALNASLTYNPTQSFEVRSQMDQVKQHIKVTWPELFQQIEAQGTFFLPEGK